MNQSLGPEDVSASIAKSTLWLSITLGVVAVGELAREVVVARLYGAGAVADAYYLGIAMPLLMKGALQTVAAQVVLPWFCLMGREDPTLGHAYMSRMFFLLLWPIVGLALLAGTLAPLLARYMAGPAIQTQMLTSVLALSLPALALGAESALLSAYLNSLEVYSPVALRTLVGSVGFVGGVVLLRRAAPAWSLGFSYLLGSVLEMLWLTGLARPSWRGLRRADAMRWRPLWQLLCKSLLPSSTLLLRQLVTMAEKILAGYLGVGSVAILSYSSRVALGMGKVFTEGMLTVVRSKASRAQARDARTEKADILSQGARQMLLLLMPVTLLVVVLRVPITRALFESQNFGAAAVRGTSDVVAAYGLGLPAFGLSPLLLIAFYACGDVTTPSLHQLLVLVLTLLLDVVAARLWGVPGIALAFVGSVCFSTLRAAWLVEKRSVRLNLWREPRFFLQLGIGGLGAGLAYGVAYALAARWLGTWLSLAAAGIMGVFVYVVIETLLGVPELRALLAWARSQHT